MLTEKQLRQLQEENEFLVQQLEEVNSEIQSREKELDHLRMHAHTTADLQSRLAMNLYEFEQMQNNIGAHQQEAAGTASRMEDLENEILASLKIERNYYNMIDENVSLQANLKDTTTELDEAAALYEKVRQLKRELTQTLSSVEIAEFEIQNLKDELRETRELNEMLLKKKSP